MIDSLKTFPVDEDYINKVSESQRRSHETSLEQNRYWLSSLVSYAFREQDPRLILDYPKLIETLTPETIQETAGKYFNTENYIRVVLKPED